MYSTQRATSSVLTHLLPYNGTAEGLMPCMQHGAEATVSRRTDDNAKAFQDFDAVKDNNRPLNINHAATARNDFLSRIGGSTQPGGSQGSSPEASLDLNYLPDSSTHSNQGELDIDTRNLIEVFLLSHTGLKHPRCSQPKALATMDRVVESLVIKHAIAYKGLSSLSSPDIVNVR